MEKLKKKKMYAIEIQKDVLEPRTFIKAEIRKTFIISEIADCTPLAEQQMCQNDALLELCLIPSLLSACKQTWEQILKSKIKLETD